MRNADAVLTIANGSLESRMFGNGQVRFGKGWREKEPQGHLARHLLHTTHCSESLVAPVADVCGIEDDLGKKGQSGVPKSVETRKSFLMNTGHRIRFVSIPKHTSWLNQIEIWFSILVRRVIKRATFTSASDPREKILAFLDYFNRTLAKPFKGTYTGRPLNVEKEEVGVELARPRPQRKVDSARVY